MFGDSLIITFSFCCLFESDMIVEEHKILVVILVLCDI